MTRNELLDIAKPINFDTLAVLAILDGHKTMFRKFIKPQPPKDAGNEAFISANCPCAVGDIFYVRETFLEKPQSIGGGFMYRADTPAPEIYKWVPLTRMPKQAARIVLKITDVRAERLSAITEADALAEGVYPITEGIDSGYYTHNPMRDSWGQCWSTAVNCFHWAVWEPALKSTEREPFGWLSDPWVWVISFEVL